MFAPDDTIVAIATPPGRGGIGVVRISGPQAVDVAAALVARSGPLQPRHATFTRLRASHDRADTPADDVVATWFPEPHSYTGQHVVEISAHGNPVVLDGIIRAAIAAGARLAEPGEFTLRSFLNGKRDLVQAEAVGDLIAAVTPLQARIAFDQLEGTLTRRIAAIDADVFDLIARLEASLDFPDEGYHFIERGAVAQRLDEVIATIDALLGDAVRGRMIREGATVVIAGRPNVGKSSLFNALAGSDRAIVTDIAGTTRDLVTERIAVDGLPVTLVDTAGVREALDTVEREGVARAVRARGVADVVVVVLDRSEPRTGDDETLLRETEGCRRLVVVNKSDLADDGISGDMPWTVPVEGAIDVSATTGAGLAEMRRALVGVLTGRESLREPAAMSNTRHVSLMESARASLMAARDAAAVHATPEEFVLVDLQSARARFDEIVGARTSDDILRHIFEKFCIGK